jgi:hypothetical protein
VTEEDYLVELGKEMMDDPVLAHQVVFAHRHGSKTPEFHEELIRLYHDESARNVLALCFRESAKSTLAEETVVLLAASGRVKNVLLVGDSWTMACARLRAIRRELENNEWIKTLYGEQIGETWSDGRIVLKNNCLITAHGQGQAIRGMKHDHYRPDLCFVDDLESKDSVATPEARSKLSDWFWKDLRPLNFDMRMLIAATPLDPKSLAVELSKLPQFKVLTVPIEYVDEAGNRKSSWPDKFPLDVIDKRKKEFFDAHKQSAWFSEYMVQAIDPASRLFRREMFRFEPQFQRTWEPVYVAYDPARSVTKTSATTGWVAGSWVGRRLVIWAAGGEKWRPSQMIDHMFHVEKTYEPIVIGVEKDGLSEWVEEPIRQEQLKRSTLLPVRALKAPKDKLGFIQRLQPLFSSGDIVFAGTAEHFSDTVEQFLNYPTGNIDIPNAFAFLLDHQLRGGQPVYEDAHEKHIAEDLAIRPGPVMLAVNTGNYGSAGVLFQYRGNVLTILWSQAVAADAGQALPSILDEAKLYAGRAITVLAPPEHFEGRTSLGLRAACRGLAEIRKGGDSQRGREVIRNLLRSDTQGCPRLLIGPEAAWARRAMMGGYARADGKSEPQDGLYATLMQALEAAMAGTAVQADKPKDAVATTADGRQYKTAEARYR